MLGASLRVGQACQAETKVPAKTDQNEIISSWIQGLTYLQQSSPSHINRIVCSLVIIRIWEMPLSLCEMIILKKLPLCVFCEIIILKENVEMRLALCQGVPVHQKHIILGPIELWPGCQGQDHGQDDEQDNGHDDGQDH